MPKGVYLHKEGVTYGMTGKCHSQETRKKISLYGKGRPAWNKGLHVFENENNPNWKGGKSKHSQGYIMILNRGHPNAQSNGYVPEHRLVMEKFLNRYLKIDEQVHHINGIVTDNRIENLSLISHSEHAKLHDRRRKRNMKGRYI